MCLLPRTQKAPEQVLVPSAPSAPSAVSAPTPTNQTRQMAPNRASGGSSRSQTPLDQLRRDLLIPPGSTQGGIMGGFYL